MWTLTRLLRISWTKHMANEEVLLRANIGSYAVKQRKIKSYLGHVLWGPKYIPLKTILAEKMFSL